MELAPDRLDVARRLIDLASLQRHLGEDHFACGREDAGRVERSRRRNSPVGVIEAAQAQERLGLVGVEECAPGSGEPQLLGGGDPPGRDVR